MNRNGLTEKAELGFFARKKIVLKGCYDKISDNLNHFLESLGSLYDSDT